MNYRESMRSFLMIRILQLSLGNTLGRWNWTTKELMSCKLRERAHVHKHGLHMINLLEKLQNLEHSVDLIIFSLLSSYEGFPMNFNVNKIDILFIRSSRGIDQCWRPMVLPSRTKSPSYLQHHRRLRIKTFIVEEEERKEFKCFIMIYNVVLSW